MVTGPRLRNSVCIALKSIDQSHGIKSKMKKKASTVTCLELIITVLLFFILNYRLTFTGLDSEFFFFFFGFIMQYQVIRLIWVQSETLLIWR